MKVGDRVIHKSGVKGEVIKSMGDNFVIDWGIGVGHIQYTPKLLKILDDYLRPDLEYYRELRLTELGINEV